MHREWSKNTNKTKLLSHNQITTKVNTDNLQITNQITTPMAVQITTKKTKIPTNLKTKTIKQETTRFPKQSWKKSPTWNGPTLQDSNKPSSLSKKRSSCLPNSLIFSKESGNLGKGSCYMVLQEPEKLSSRKPVRVRPILSFSVWALQIWFPNTLEKVLRLSRLYSEWRENKPTRSFLLTKLTVWSVHVPKTRTKRVKEWRRSFWFRCREWGIPMEITCLW